jgi:hypothetical protein
MRKCKDYKDLTLQDNWEQILLEWIQRDIDGFAFSVQERAQLLERLQIARGEWTIAYGDTFSALYSATKEQLLYIREAIRSIHQSMSVWHDPETIIMKNWEVQLCVSEALAIRTDAIGLGLGQEFRACTIAGSEATKKSVALLSYGPEVREHLIKNIKK